jgi:diaminopropionate ammonia-lyase
MLAEIDDQIADDDTDPQATQTVVPVGVGSLAQAVLLQYRSASCAGPRVISVATASCVAKSLLAGRITSVRTSETIMTGLSCGTPSPLAWPYLSSGLDTATAVTDAEALTQHL